MDTINTWIPDQTYNECWLKLNDNQKLFIQTLIDGAVANKVYGDKAVMQSLGLASVTMWWWMQNPAFKYCHDVLRLIISNEALDDVAAKKLTAKSKAWSIINEALEDFEDKERQDNAAGKVLGYEKAELAQKIDINAKVKGEVNWIVGQGFQDTEKPVNKPDSEYGNKPTGDNTANEGKSAI